MGQIGYVLITLWTYGVLINHDSTPMRPRLASLTSGSRPRSAAPGPLQVILDVYTFADKNGLECGYQHFLGNILALNSTSKGV